MRCLLWLVAVSLCAAPALGLAAPPQVKEVKAGARRGRPLRLGIVHPSPRLCVGQERSQKDVRVLRLAFRLEAPPNSPLALPWFYRRVPGGEAGPGLLALDTRALWGLPVYSLTAAHANFVAAGGTDLLLEWRDRVTALLPELVAAPLLSQAQFSLPLQTAGPFWASRLRGSGTVPYYSAGASGFADGASGYVSEASGNASGTAGNSAPCVRWPLDIVHSPGEGAVRYRLQYRGEAGVPYRLTAYLTLKRMLRDVRSGRLDAALLEGQELAGALDARPVMAAAVLGRALGSQQVVLRLRPGLHEEIGTDAVRILSMATPRRRLAPMAGAGFSAAEAFLIPLIAPPAAREGGVLRWNALLARKNWLRKPRARTRFALAVLAHPILQRVARGLADQWKKTLGVELSVTSLPAEKFTRMDERSGFDMALTVADLDDGSLQDLWRDALADQPASPAPQPGREARLRETLPNLPLLHNAHFLLAGSARAYARASATCPTCRAITLEAYRRGQRP